MRRAEERVANVGAHENKDPPQDQQVHLLEQVPMGEQVPVPPYPKVDISQFGPSHDFPI